MARFLSARSFMLAMALALVPVFTNARAAETDVDSLHAELRSLVERARNKVFPALVNIQLVTSMYFDGKEVKGRAVGSGTIIDAAGHVLTNQHVTNKGRRFRCTLLDKQEVAADLVGEDPLTDLAVLKLRLDQLPSGMKLPIAALGDSGAVDIGDFVLAMGSPLALSRSVTLGIVSNTERVFADGLQEQDPDDMRLSRGQRTGLFTRWIQHDALINPGNSGGPLVNLRGEIIGVNELGGNSIGFAIPSNLAREVADQLIAHGEVARSWVGMSVQPTAKTGYDHGVLINSVLNDSPASRAGLAAGDLLIELAGELVNVRFAEEVPLLLKRVADLPVGTSLAVKYERSGMLHDASIVTEKMENDEGRERELRKWGITAQEITDLTAREQLLEGREGALVTGVRGGGAAASAKPALASGDVIRAIDGTAIDSLDELVERYQAITTQDPLPESILVEFVRSGERYVTLMKPQTSDDEPEPNRTVVKAWLGITVQPVLKPLAKRLGVTSAGFRITRVYPHTTAAGSELAVGDIVTHLNGRRIEPRRTEDALLLSREIQELSLDAAARLTIVRGDATREVEVPLEPTKLSPDEAPRERNRDFELTVREITFFDRVEQHWGDDVEGVVTLGAEGAGWAGLGGVQPGDLIQKIGDHLITDLASFREAMKAIAETKPARVVFAVRRGVRTRFQFAEPDWNPEQKDAERTTAEK